VSKHRSTALATRAAIVAGATAAAAVIGLLPGPPEVTAHAVPAAPAAQAVDVQAVDVVPVAQVTPAPAALAVPSRGAVSAMANAMSKIGAPYKWGATGPNAFDCSGLVSWAFKNAGITLPRTSRAMASVGKPVAKSDLRPGDLVFFYKPVSHVGIYIGDGKIVHASSKKSPVKVSSMSGMAFTTARRI
jgi:cell wall-associated NlpC family hydrolase